jgi:hypothetical protein
LVIGKRPHKIKIKFERDINGGCDRNNFWDEVVKTLIMQILDINVVEWEGHKPESLKKLKASLNLEFEYVHNELFLIGHYYKSWFFKRFKLINLSF